MRGLQACGPCGGCVEALQNAFSKDRFLFRDDGATWKQVFGKPSRFARCLSPRALLAIRAVLFALSFGLLIWSSVHEALKGEYGRWWIFLTHWTLTWETLYLCASTASTAMALYSSVPDGKGDAIPWFAAVTWAMQGAAMVMTLLVFVLFWLLEYNPEEDTITALTLSAHGGNCLLPLFELLLSNNPWHLAQMYVPLLYGTIYLLFTIVYQVIKDDYIYRVLDWSKPAAAAQMGVIIVFVVVPICWALFWFLVRWRQSAAQQTVEKTMGERAQPDVVEVEV